MIPELRKLEPEPLLWQLLGAYEVADSYEPWCELVGLTPRTDAANLIYDHVHESYASLWTTMGETFFDRLAITVAFWKDRVQGRGKLATVRSFVRL